MRGKAASGLIASAALLASCGWALGGGFYSKGPASLDKAGDGVSGLHGIGTQPIPGAEGRTNQVLKKK